MASCCSQTKVETPRQEDLGPPRTCTRPRSFLCLCCAEQSLTVWGCLFRRHVALSQLRAFELALPSAGRGTSSVQGCLLFPFKFWLRVPVLTELLPEHPLSSLRSLVTLTSRCTALPHGTDVYLGIVSPYQTLSSPAAATLVCYLGFRILRSPLTKWKHPALLKIWGRGCRNLLVTITYSQCLEQPCHLVGGQ